MLGQKIQQILYQTLIGQRFPNLACAPEPTFISPAMRPVQLLALYFAVVFLGGALLAPWLHALAQATAQSLPALQGIAEAPFHRYMTRCWMIAGVLGLWPLARAIGLDSREKLGLRVAGNGRNGVLAGFALGFVTLALAAGLTVGLGPRTWNLDHSIGVWAEYLFKAAAAAAAVSVIEEVFFRGVLFGALRQSMRWQGALLASSMVYAFLHFSERAVHEGPVTWSSGLALLPRMLRGFGDVEALVPGFFNLMLAGGLLGLAYQRTGDLRFAIGLHAGWIFWLKSYGLLTSAGGGEAAASWLWGTGKLIDGWMCLPLLLAAAPLVNRLNARPEGGHSLHGHAPGA